VTAIVIGERDTHAGSEDHAGRDAGDQPLSHRPGS
jgi:hypothetical protein